MLSQMEDGYLSSPASSPDVFFDEDKFLVKSIASKSNEPLRKIKWYHYTNLPMAIMSVSLCQIIFHVSSTLALNKLLRFEPTRRLELWRYVTYMLVHDDWSHLVLNVIIQCIFAALLELNQGRFRVLAVYFLGGISGVLGAACLHPDLVIGASAGGYSLLLSNVADLMLNYETINYKMYRSVSICTLVLFDVLYDIVHVCTKKEPQVSWQAHFFGGISGIFLGLVFFQCQKPNKTRKTLFCVGLTFYLIFVFSFIGLTVQIGKCATKSANLHHYIYLC